MCIYIVYCIVELARAPNVKFTIKFLCTASGEIQSACKNIPSSQFRLSTKQSRLRFRWEGATLFRNV